MKKIIGSSVIAGGCLAFATAFAQVIPPQLILTWQASTYTPQGFAGKVLPASDSPITLGVDLVDNGKLVNLSPFKVYWYVNDVFYKGAPGMTRLTLSAPHFIGETSIRVRVLISDYPGNPGKTVTIPVVPPEAVIQSSAPSLSATDAPFSLQAYPYFFNIQDSSELSFTWLLNGTIAGSQNPFVVTKDIARGGPAEVELRVSNPARPLERLTSRLFILR